MARTLPADRGPRREGELDWATAGLMPLPGDAATVPFPAGTIAAPPESGEAPLAVLRIGLFSAQGFPQLCEAEWPRFLAAGGAGCTDCLDPFWDHLQMALVAAGVVQSNSASPAMLAAAAFAAAAIPLCVRLPKPKLATA